MLTRHGIYIATASCSHGPAGGYLHEHNGSSLSQTCHHPVKRLVPLNISQPDSSGTCFGTGTVATNLYGYLPAYLVGSWP